MEWGKPGIVGFISMGGMSMTIGNGLIMEETVEIHDLPKKVPMVLPSLKVLQGHLWTICPSVRVVGNCAPSSFHSKEIGTKKVAKA